MRCATTCAPRTRSTNEGRRASEPRSSGAPLSDAPPAPRSLSRPQRSIEKVAQALRVAVRLELGQRLGLDLADALAGDAELLADFLEGARMLALEAETQLDDLALAVRERAQDEVELFFLHDLADGLDRDRGFLVLDEVAELRVFFLADRCLETHGLLADLEDLTDFLRRRAHLRGDLVRSGLAADVLQQLALHADELVDGLDHVHRDADRACLVGDGARDRLADPPGGVGAELVAFAVVELLDGADEAEVAFLDEIQEQHASAHVALGDGHDEAQVGLDELALGVHVAALDALGQRHLFFGREERYLADLLEIHAHGVVGERLRREIELGDGLLLGFCLGAVVAGGHVALDDVDAEVGDDGPQAKPEEEAIPRLDLSAKTPTNDPVRM